FPFILFDTTPPPALPASSPVLTAKFESCKQIGLPSHLTDELPWAVSEDLAIFGYGIGTGPPGVGVLQTSGNAVVMPPLSAWTTERLLTPTVTPIGQLVQFIFTHAPFILLAPEARLTISVPFIITFPSLLSLIELFPQTRKISSSFSMSMLSLF